MIQGRENLEAYRFGNGHLQKTFCKICGVNLTNEASKLSDEELADLPRESLREWHKRFQVRCGFNIHVLDDFDLGSIKDPWKNTRGTEMEPRYIYP